MSVTRKFHLLAVIPMLLTLLLATGCANKPPANLNEYYRATVSAGTSAVGQDRLKKYNARLKQIAGFSNLEEDWIGCINCTEVENGTPKSYLMYVFYREHKRSLKMIARAWNDVHHATKLQPEINAFTLLYDSEPLPPQACPVSPPAPSGCTGVPTCISSDRCDRYFPDPAGCQKCAW